MENKLAGRAFDALSEIMEGSLWFKGSFNVDFDPLIRQLEEAVRIDHQEGIGLNDKSEFV